MRLDYFNAIVSVQGGDPIFETKEGVVHCHLGAYLDELSNICITHIASGAQITKLGNHAELAHTLNVLMACDDRWEHFDLESDPLDFVPEQIIQLQRVYPTINHLAYTDDMPLDDEEMVDISNDWCYF